MRQPRAFGDGNAHDRSITQGRRSRLARPEASRVLRRRYDALGAWRGPEGHCGDRTGAARLYTGALNAVPSARTTPLGSRLSGATAGTCLTRRRTPSAPCTSARGPLRPDLCRGEDDDKADTREVEIVFVQSIELGAAERAGNAGAAAARDRAARRGCSAPRPVASSVGSLRLVPLQ